MIKFLFKGIIRDSSRSVLPVLIVSLGVALTVLLSGYIKGMMGDTIDQNARFETGHVKVMTRTYAENKDQVPIDLALLGVDSLVESLEKEFPDMEWVQRTRFGGLIDVPDERGETKGQGPASGLAIELVSDKNNEVERLNLKSSLVTGSIPTAKGEVIIGHEFAEKLHINIGDTITYFGTTMNGSMTFKNFVVRGTIRFGIPSMDKGAIIVDVSDAQQMLDMEDGAGEILGYLNSGVYEDEKATEIKEEFNSSYAGNEDEFAPVMVKLRDQNNLEGMLTYIDLASGLFVAIFVFAMSLVLWNTGLIAGLRRYNEFGIRLALGESKGAIYRTLVYEALLIGFIGSIVGTAIGLGLTYYLQVVGIDISGYLDQSNVMMPSTLRAKVTPSLFYIGFIPGLFAMVFGNMLAGIGIYRRETATLFKELEV